MSHLKLGRVHSKVTVAVLLVWLFITGLFVYWYGIANRHEIFLYEHLGLGPFDEITRSRYWMAGLVAAGAVMILYAGGNWLLARVALVLNTGYEPPVWWRVWLGCCAPVSISTLLITMTLNQPTLPFEDGVKCTLATIAGLGLALMPSALAAEKPDELFWIGLNGVGLMPVLLLFRVIDQPSQRLLTDDTARLIVIMSLGIEVVWLVGIVSLRRRLKKTVVSSKAIVISGLSLSYLLLPLFHYLFLVPEDYRYITAAGNFFAPAWETQFLSLSIAIGLVFGVNWMQSKFTQGAINYVQS